MSTTHQSLDAQLDRLTAAGIDRGRITTGPRPHTVPNSVERGRPATDFGDLLGWWPSFEHYSCTGSNPRGTSADLKTIERTIDHFDGPPRKWCVIGRQTRQGWVLIAKRHQGRTVELTTGQRDSYLKARGGGPWGNQGSRPPHSELNSPTVNLDDDL